MRRSAHRPLLGTLVEVGVDGVEDGTAEVVDDVVVAEMERLERVFSIHDPESELERWKRGEVESPGADLASALVQALGWERRSHGAFHLASLPATRLWHRAADRGWPPTDDETAEVVAALADPAIVVEGGCIRPVGDLSTIDLNAFAKGWIVDRAIDVAVACVEEHERDARPDIVVSAGGDLRHRGPHPTVVGIENPLRPYDNEPPLELVEVADAGLATSGRARRGVRVGDRWYGHVIDPRTARPVDDIASISIVAPDAVTADVVATIAGVELPDRAIAVADDHQVACLVVTPAGERLANSRWVALRRA